MTSQKTIERCRLRVKELESANANLIETNGTLLANNVTLNDRLQTIEKELKFMDNTVKNREQAFNKLQKEKDECKQKCEIVLSEKNRILQEKESYIRNLHDTIWHLRNSFKCETYQFSETQKGFKFEFEFGRK
jgi:predicted nuclease with TOPRIM domain